MFVKYDKVKISYSPPSASKETSLNNTKHMGKNSVWSWYGKRVCFQKMPLCGEGW